MTCRNAGEGLKYISPLRSGRFKARIIALARVDLRTFPHSFMMMLTRGEVNSESDAINVAVVGVTLKCVMKIVAFRMEQIFHYRCIRKIR